MKRKRFQEGTMIVRTAIMLCLCLVAGAFAQQTTGDFDPAGWDLSQAKIEEHLGRKALIGTAFLKDVRLQNGIIEVDIATTNRTRSYPGVLFRVQDAANYERFYIRPHRSPFYDDVLQYGPTFNGVDSWQLYNGPGLTSRLDVLPDRWNRLKIVVAGKQAQVFWNDIPEPVLVVDDLARGESAGTIGLVGPMDGTAYFSNLSYEINDGLALPPPPPSEAVCGIIGGWEISEPFAALQADFTKYPDPILKTASWKPALTDDRGFIDISRFYPRKNQAGDCVLARTILRTETDTSLRAAFGYSDFITVFLNRQPLYFGNAAYRSRDTSFLGIVGYFDNLFLPLKKGDNELLVMVGESMGGWAFGFRREDESFMHSSVKKEWGLQGALALPEAAVFDPKQNACYVSNYFNEGQEFLSRISPAGEIIELEWIKGLRMPTGMWVKGNALYAVDRSGLNVIDIKNGKVTAKIPLPGLRMANDVTMDREGNLYISDTPAGAVYRYSRGKLELWLKDLSRPNALLCEKSRLLVGQKEKLIAVDLKSKAAQTLAVFARGANVDGIESDGSGGYLVGNHNGKLFRLNAKGEKTLLLDTSNPGDKIADFAYIPELKLIVIPTFDGNSLAAYTLK